MSGDHRQGGGRAARHHLRAAVRGQAGAGHRRRPGTWPAPTPSIALGGIQADRRHGAWAPRAIERGRHAGGARQRLRRRGQAPALRPRRHRPVRRTRPRPWSSPTTAAAMANSCATDLLGQAEHGPDSPAILHHQLRETGARRRCAEVERLLTDPADRRPSRRRAWETYGEVIVCRGRGRDGARIADDYRQRSTSR